MTFLLQVDFIDLNLGCPLDAVNDKCGGCALANRLGRCIDVLKSMNLVAGDVPITTKMRYGMHQGTRTAHYLMKRLVEAGVTQSITLHPRSRFLCSLDISGCQIFKKTRLLLLLQLVFRFN